MPDNIEPKVPEGQQGAVVPGGTPAPGGVPTGTPSQAPGDAEVERVRQQAAKLQQDLNAMKSSFQKKESQLLREREQREAELRRELEQARVAGMDDETRKLYQQERASERVTELETQLTEMQQRYEEMQAFQNALSHFRSNGIPDSALVLDGTTEDLVASGWNWMAARSREAEELKARLSQTPTPPPSPSPLPSAPPVALGGTASPPSTKATWKELEAKWGSREAVYQAVEERRLPPTIIPD